MPRRKRMRRISRVPNHFGFQAIYPENSTSGDKTAVVLHLEEYEALKLMDYEMHSQAEAAEYMAVSRPTITRIYESARQKMAKALIEGRTLRISGGDYELSEEWLTCQDCQSGFSKNNDTENCPWCGSSNTRYQSWED